MRKKAFRLVRALDLFVQALWSLVFPAGLFVWLGWSMTNRWGCGRWAAIAGIAVGAVCSMSCFFRFLLAAGKSLDPPKKGGVSNDGKSE